jgi:isoquinoline 1-oxidoreductase beta subunit
VVQLVAEELDVEPARFVVEHAPPDDAVYGIPSGQQITGGSTTIRGMWTPMRMVGALTRGLFVDAAARRWGVTAASCRTQNSVVHHDASRRSLAYGALVDDVAAQPPLSVDVRGMAPAEVRLKARKDFRVIGTPLARLEGPAKVNGETLYGIDVKRPGMRVGTVIACPVFGGKLASVDDAKARSIPGVRQVVKLDDAVAVIGDHFWAAQRGVLALDVRWDEGAQAKLSTLDLFADLAKAADSAGRIAHEAGDPDAALKTAAKRVHATYQTPLLAHAAMEPPNCVAFVHDGSCELWVGTQVPARAQRAVAEALGIPPSKVSVHNQYIGSAFGRRLEVDFIVQAARIAAQVDAPVKVVWSREEDIQHDLYRPCYYDRLSAGLDADGRLVAWKHRIAGSSIMARYAPDAIPKDGVDDDAVECARNLLYDVPTQRVDYVRVEPRTVPTSWWRGVGATHNVYVIESFVDELAHAAGIDPLEFRRRALASSPRARAVLAKAATEAKWGTPLAKGRGRGVAVAQVFGSELAIVAEVSVSPEADVRVEHVVCAIDCGIAVNPAHVARQVEGGVLFGLGPVLYDAVTISNGRVEQSNFHDYRVMRMPDTPRIDVHIIESGESPGGIGETGTALIAPAVLNAIFAATGKRVRKLPVTREDLRAT